jgi:hypothetical protein
MRSGDVGSIPIGRANFDGPLSWIIGEVRKDERVQIPPQPQNGWVFISLFVRRAF